MQQQRQEKAAIRQVKEGSTYPSFKEASVTVQVRVPGLTVRLSLVVQPQDVVAVAGDIGLGGLTVATAGLQSSCGSCSNSQVSMGCPWGVWLGDGWGGGRIKGRAGEGKGGINGGRGKGRCVSVELQQQSMGLLLGSVMSMGGLGVGGGQSSCGSCSTVKQDELRLHELA